jgi:hypothetical protein
VLRDFLGHRQRVPGREVRPLVLGQELEKFDEVTRHGEPKGGTVLHHPGPEPGALNQRQVEGLFDEAKLEELVEVLFHELRAAGPGFAQLEGDGERLGNVQIEEVLDVGAREDGEERGRRLPKPAATSIDRRVGTPAFTRTLLVRMKRFDAPVQPAEILCAKAWASVSGRLNSLCSQRYSRVVMNSRVARQGTGAFVSEAAARDRVENRKSGASRFMRSFVFTS